MSSRLECFVTFCGADAGDQHVEQLVKQLKTRTGRLIKYHVYFEKTYGDSLHDFMQTTLEESQVVLALFGPDYKARVDKSLENTGVWKEFNTIVTRLEDTNNYETPNVVPVFWAGNSYEDAQPSYFSPLNPYACDLSKLRAFGSDEKGWSFPKAILAQHHDRLDRVADALLEKAAVQDKEVMETKRHHLQELLLPTQNIHTKDKLSIREVLELKYEHGDYDAKEFKERFFTSTRFFRALKGRNVGLISGRKGSGKTTLVDIRELEAETNNYFPVIDIEVDGWNLHAIIQTGTFQQAEGDFEYVDVDVKFFDFVWAGFCSLAICCSIIEESCDVALTPSSLVVDPTVTNKLTEIISNSSKPTECNYAQLFLLATQAARNYFQASVDNASSTSEEEFVSDVIGTVSVSSFMESLYGNDLVILRDAIEQFGDRRFLFCFDRFDTEIQQYRKDYEHSSPEKRQLQAKREIDWLSSLTMFVEKTLRPDGPETDLPIYQFFQCVKFLVVLPHDRILEIRGSQRDSVASESIEEIRWQPKELLTMLRKRMQALYGVSDEKLDKTLNKTPLQRFERVTSISCKKLPKQAYISIGSKQFKIDLFLDVLRHSFFRPRDILIHYAAILSYHDTMISRERQIDIEAIRVAISNETRTIVNSEFIGELKDTWTNIETVLREFQGRDQVMSKRTLEEIIGVTNFSFYDDSIAPVTFDEKVAFLYNIGFLGYRSTRPVGSRRNQLDFTFSFFARSDPPSFAKAEIAKHLEFAIHPIFIETLYLHVNAKTPVMNFTWENLEQIDRMY